MYCELFIGHGSPHSTHKTAEHIISWWIDLDEGVVK